MANCMYTIFMDQLLGIKNSEKWCGDTPLFFRVFIKPIKYLASTLISQKFCDIIYSLFGFETVSSSQIFLR